MKEKLRPLGIVLWSRPNDRWKLEIRGYEHFVVERDLIGDRKGHPRFSRLWRVERGVPHADLDLVSRANLSEGWLLERQPVTKRFGGVRHSRVHGHDGVLIEAFRNEGGDAAGVGWELDTVVFGPRVVFVAVDLEDAFRVRRAGTENALVVLRWNPLRVVDQRPRVALAAGAALTTASGPVAASACASQKKAERAEARDYAPRGTLSRTRTSGFTFRAPSAAVYGLIPKSGW